MGLTQRVITRLFRTSYTGQHFCAGGGVCVTNRCNSLKALLKIRKSISFGVLDLKKWNYLGKKKRRKGCQYKLEIKRETQEGEKTNAHARTVRN
jgi:hypothetical protein